jgi:hypothetical protein
MRISVAVDRREYSVAMIGTVEQRLGLLHD